MNTYVKVIVGKSVWRTNVDKNNHVNPKWHEVFYLKYKYLNYYLSPRLLIWSQRYLLVFRIGPQEKVLMKLLGKNFMELNILNMLK